MSDWDSVRQRVIREKSHRRESTLGTGRPSALWEISPDSREPSLPATRWPRLRAAWQRATRYVGSLLRS